MRRIVNLAVIVLLLAGIFVGWSPDGTRAAELKIGAIIPTSGGLASYGQGQIIAMNIALDEINAAGGVNGMKLKPIIIDNHSKKEEAIIATRRLIDRENVLTIWGPFTSGESENAFPVANRAGVTIISSSSAKPGVAAKNRPWAFRNSLTTDKLYGALVTKWITHFGIKNVVIIYDSQEAVMKATATKVFPFLLKRTGAKIIDFLTFESKDIDFSAQITKAKLLNPDGMIVHAIHSGAALIAKEMAKQGFRAPVLGGLGHDARYLDRAGPAGNGAWTAQGFWPDSPVSNIRNFVRKFKERSQGGLNPNQEMAALYDTVHITAKIIKEQGVSGDPAKLKEDREKIRRGWETLKDYKGITGATTMTKSGDTFKTSTMLVAKDGKFLLIK